MDVIGSTVFARQESVAVSDSLNTNLKHMDSDILYHLNLSTETHDLKKMFGDVKFVCMGGSSKRALKYALLLKKLINYDLPIGHALSNISEEADRYSMYKVGPILCVSHGMGCPSISILLNELIKLMHHSGCRNVTFFRIGTCGGIGLNPGSVVISSEVVDGMFRPEFRQIVLGKEVSRETKLDSELGKELVSLGKKYEIFDTVLGKTMCTHDFYEGQGRLDGAFCDYTLEDKSAFLKECHKNGVFNMEMESLSFASILNRTKFKSAIICVTLVDRLLGDQIDLTAEMHAEYQERPFKIVADYILRHLE